MSKTPFSKGNQLFRESKFEAAINEYKKSLKKKETYLVYENMGMAYERLKKTREAEEAYGRAISLNPQSVRAVFYFRKNNFRKNNKFSSVSGDSRNNKKSASLGGVPDQACPAVDAVADPPSEELQVLYAHRCPFEDELEASYRVSALSSEADTFVLYRIIGNDLYPRHAKGQSRQNVRFILENEPELEGCEKRWVLNRIFDVGERQAIIDLLEQHSQTYLEIPFEAGAFAQIGWDYSTYPEPGFLSSATLHKLGPLQQERVVTAAYRQKNLYLMNNNGARNAALEDGVGRAKWVLPWDGNCFVTPSAWEQIRSSVLSAPHLPYFAVPMQRINDNAELLRNNFTPNPVEEPQLLFRRDARERLGENHPYGRRPKVELFWRLGIPGKWDRWKDDPWEQPRSEPSPDAGSWGVAGWVARLASGKAHLEASTTESFKNRGRERQKAIRAAINHVTREVSARPDPMGLTCYRFELIKALRTECQDQGESGPQAELLRTLLQNAAEALERQPESPVDKPEPGPSGDLQDYFHPAPYWWPNPDTQDGLPFVKRDGERVPGTRMYEPESRRYDRTRVQRLFDDTTTLSLAAYVTGEQRYAVHAVRWLERWFIDPVTRMNPHLTYAQVRWGHNNARGAQSGVIEMKDLYYALDAIRLLNHFGTLSDDKLEALRIWCREYLDWLLTSEQGTKEAQARNNHGTYYDLQVAALAAFLDDTDTLYATLARAEERIPLQITPEGVQHEEMTRTKTAHYCCFTLMGWLNLLSLAARYDGTMIQRVSEPDHPLRKAVEWLVAHEVAPWPYPQIDEFDHRRFSPIKLLSKSLGLFSTEPEGSELSSVPSCLAPHDGVQVYWPLAISDQYSRHYPILGGNHTTEWVSRPASNVPPVVKTQDGDSVLGLRESAHLPVSHYVFMRFGVGIFDPNWLRHRLGLLKSVAIPSLKAQKGVRFNLVLMVDEALPEPFLREVKLLIKSIPGASIEYLELHADRARAARRITSEALEDVVIATRLDDDDALTENAFRTIQEKALEAAGKEVKQGVVAIRSGYFWVPEKMQAVTKEHKALGIGLSFFFPRGEWVSIFQNHLTIPEKFSEEKGELIYINKDGGEWAYTLHHLADTSVYKRMEKITDSKNKEKIGESFLRKFNIDLNKLDDWKFLEGKFSLCVDDKVTVGLKQIEDEIAKERKKRGSDESEKDSLNKIEELKAKRVEKTLRITCSTQEKGRGDDA